MLELFYTFIVTLHNSMSVQMSHLYALSEKMQRQEHNRNFVLCSHNLTVIQFQQAQQNFST